MAPGLRCRALTTACSGSAVRGKESGHPTDCNRQSRQQTVGWVYESPPARQAGQEGSNSLRSIRGKRYLFGSPAELASPATSIATLRCEIVPGQADHKLTDAPPHRYKGKRYGRQCRDKPATDSHPAVPPAPGEHIAREAEYQRHHKYPESGHLILKPSVDLCVNLKAC